MGADYAAMTNTQLNRLISERRGWRVVEWDAAPDGHGVGYWLQRPDGTFVGNKAWRTNRWTPDEFFSNQETLSPHWTEDASAALELLKDMNGELYWYADAWQAAPEQVSWTASHERASRAISEAFMIHTDHWPTPAMLAAPARPDAPGDA